MNTNKLDKAAEQRIRQIIREELANSSLRPKPIEANIVVDARIVAISDDVRKQLADIMAANRPGAPRKSSRKGFTQKQIAKWFLVSEREVSRWETGSSTPPIGYSVEMRMSGDWNLIENVLKNHIELKRSQTCDAFGSGKVIRGMSEEEIYRKRRK